MVEYLEVNSLLVQQWSFSVTLALRCMDQMREHVRMIKLGTALSQFVMTEVSDLGFRSGLK